MHVSLDGFVAGPKGGMDWIRFDEELFNYIGNRIRKNNTSLYGRVTFQMMESYWPTAADRPSATKHDVEHSRWYMGAHKIVLSRTLNEAGRPDTTFISNDLPGSIATIKKQEGEEVLLFGSPGATHSLMQHDLIDGYWLFVKPVVLGKGIPLFLESDRKVSLELLPATRQFSCGVTELNYLVERSGAL